MCWSHWLVTLSTKALNLNYFPIVLFVPVLKIEVGFPATTGRYSAINNTPSSAWLLKCASCLLIAFVKMNYLTHRYTLWLYGMVPLFGLLGLHDSQVEVTSWTSYINENSLSTDVADLA